MFNSLFTSTTIQNTTTMPDGAQTTTEIVASDFVEITPLPAKPMLNDGKNRPAVVLRTSQSFKLPSKQQQPSTSKSNSLRDKKSSHLNTSRSRAYTAPSTEMPFVSLPQTGQSISNLALDRSCKYNSGRVKKHRDKFEGKTERKSAPTSSSIVVIHFFNL